MMLFKGFLIILVIIISCRLEINNYEKHRAKFFSYLDITLTVIIVAWITMLNI